MEPLLLFHTVHKGAGAFLNDSAAALAAYPDLILVEGGVPELSGNIVICNDAGTTLDQYEVRIVSTENYPELFPHVFETGGKIPINIDWHVFESDGHLCICTLTDECLKTVNGLPLVRFIKEELEPYLFNQSYRRKTGFFRHERAHGMHGQIESLQQLLRTDDLGNMSWLLGQAIAGYKMERTSLCFCGSKRKYRHCHRDILERFKKMGPGKLSLLKKMIDDYIIAA